MAEAEENMFNAIGHMLGTRIEYYSQEEQDLAEKFSKTLPEDYRRPSRVFPLAAFVNPEGYHKLRKDFYREIDKEVDPGKHFSDPDFDYHMDLLEKGLLDDELSFSPEQLKALEQAKQQINKSHLLDKESPFRIEESSFKSLEEIAKDEGLEDDDDDE